MKDRTIVCSVERLVRYSPERVVEPGKKLDQAYASMSESFERDVTEEKAGYLYSLRKTFDESLFAPYILLVTCDRNEKVISLISGNYMPLIRPKTIKKKKIEKAVLKEIIYSMCLWGIVEKYKKLKNKPPMKKIFGYS